MERGLPVSITIDPATGQEIATYADGTTLVVDPDETPTPSIVAEGTPNAIPGAAGTSGPVSEPLYFVDPSEGDTGLSGGNGSGGYQKRGYSRGSYADYGSSGYDDDFVPHPTYANGALHPAWGGEPLVPGGQFAALDDGYDNRQQVRVPGGATAGPFEVSAAPSGFSAGGAPSGSYGGSATGGGGGGDVRGLIGAWRDKLIGGMYPGSSSSSYDSSSYGSGGTHEERMRGPYARGMDPTQAAGLTMRPTAMLPEVFPHLGPETPAYQRLAALPAAQIAMLRNGYKDTTSSLVNQLGKTYQQAGAGNLPSTKTMIGNLSSGKGINDLFAGEKAGKGDYPSSTVPGYAYGQEPLLLGEASSTVGGLLDAALINEPALTQAKYSGTMPGSWGSYLIDKWGSKALQHKPGKGPQANQYVGRRIFRSG